MSDIVTDHQPMEAVHIDDRPWETLRWLGQWSKMLFYPDPHWEAPLSTSTGGLMHFVQYQGPTTGGRPIYDGRFNKTARKPVAEENLER
jgi:hypothetical protein